MAVNTQFSIAVHIMAGVGYRCGGEVTSANLARSVNTSPSFVRRTLARLSKAGLILTARGKSGACRLGRDASRISLLDIYRAVGAPPVFSVHRYSIQKSCVVSRHIKDALNRVLEKSQRSMEKDLAKTSLADVIAETHA